MVFSSVPAYLDPSNWQQQQPHQIIGNSAGNHPLLPPGLPQSAAGPAAPPPPHGSGGGAGSIRPGSMSERARIANIPMPETALKCPRCESTNTKFCYFNNYSLTQPRHFCKTCRRYWTRGGALRNVPVGGGCRRNKRSSKSSSNSKSSPASGDRQASAASTSTISANSVGTGGGGSIFGHHAPQLPPQRFMSPLSQLTDNFTSVDSGLNYSTPNDQMNTFFSGASLFSSGGGGGASIEPWRFQQFPFLNGGGLDPSPPGIYQFHGGESGFLGGEPRPKISNSLLSQLASVKMEENREMNLSRQLAGGINPGNDNNQWNNNGNNAWTDLSSFSSSSTSNQL